MRLIWEISSASGACRAAGISFRSAASKKMIFRFAGRTVGDGDEALQLRVAIATAALGEIGADGSARAPQLAGEAETFLLWKGPGERVDVEGQPMTALPDLECAVVFHSESETDC